MQAVLDAGKAAGLPVTLEATEGESRVLLFAVQP